MLKKVLLPVGVQESTALAAGFLASSGFLLTDHPSPDITHILLDVPSFRSEGLLRDGGDLKDLLRMLPQTVTVVGYGLDREFLKSYRTIDLAEDPLFLAKNAAITAECALRMAAPYLPCVLKETPVLILGWGRIGKCLSRLLMGFGAPVTVAARKPEDRAMAEALGLRAVDFSDLDSEARRHRLLLNTVPQGIRLREPAGNCIRMDLASLPGLQGEDVIAARGLPGKYAPESAGRLIAETLCRREKEESA